MRYIGALMWLACALSVVYPYLTESAIISDREYFGFWMSIICSTIWINSDGWD